MPRSGQCGLGLLALALLAGCATPAPPPRVAGPPVPARFVIGPAYFQGADSIRIDAVEASSPGFLPGDRVVVRGWYDLATHESAELRLFIRSFGVPRYLPVLPAHSTIVQRGVGPFQFEWVVPLPGALYVAFYPEEGGGPFGGVYFGTAGQMSRAASIEGM
ncbi:MAG TPA: hypothetical protein VMD31_01440 [Opitutaceae bacterium]|nr:hypothetical protein [Opitutaceae bacterium]